MSVPFSYFFDWMALPDALCNNIFNEFKDNGVTNFVVTDTMLRAALVNPRVFTRFKRMSLIHNITFGDAHLPCGQPYDLCCAERARRKGMLEDQKRAMAYAAELGCKTCTVHMGAYESVYFKTPNDVLRPYVVESLGILLEEAKQLDIVLAIENSYERSNTPGEVLYYMSCFDTPHLGVCYDAGHACMMEDFPGKKREKYFAPMDHVWGDVVECYHDAIGDLLPHMVTCHLHDNDGYSDAHQMPGDGRIEWKELIAKIKTAPRLLTMQSEVLMIDNGYSVRRLVDTFNKLLAE